MICFQLPDGSKMNIEHVIFDYNGTLATDGKISDDIKPRLIDLAKKVHVVVVTADTFGRAQEQLGGVTEVELVIMNKWQNGRFKAEFVSNLGANVLVLGNGVNDNMMFDTAPLSIGVISKEGASGKTLALADIVVTRIEDAFDLLLSDKRMIATLRK